MILALLLVFADDPRTEEAKYLYRQAETHYKLGRFDSALGLFQKAYEVKPTPGLLFNIGQCHFQLKDYERAIFFYEGFLREGTPNASVRFKVNGQLADARRELAKQKREARDRPMPAAPATQAAVAEQPRTIVSTPATQPQIVTTAPPPEEVSTPVYKRWWLWTIVGVAVAGGAAAAVTVVLLNQPKPNVVDWR